MAFHIVLKKSTEAVANNTFVINNLGSLSLDLSTPLTPMPLPEESDQENILVKMEGNTQIVPVSWTLKTETTAMIGKNTAGESFWHDAGTWKLKDPTTANHLSQFEQINWLQNIFAPNSVDDGYQFAIYDDDDGTGAVFIRDGSITNLRFAISGNSPVVWDASCNFIVGDAVAAFESNSPERPTFKSLTSAVAGEAVITWLSFQGYATGEEPIYAATDIRYKKATGGNWETFDTGILGADTLKNATITGLTSNTEYIFKVSDNNSESDSTQLRHFSISRRIVIA